MSAKSSRRQRSTSRPATATDQRPSTSTSTVQRSRTRSGRVFRTYSRTSPSESQTKLIRKERRKIYAQDIVKRIAKIPIKGLPIPNTENLRILGAELKLRLAMISDIITELPARRDQQVKVVSTQDGFRHVPIWFINSDQDPELVCEVKVGVIPNAKQSLKRREDKRNTI